MNARENRKKTQVGIELIRLLATEGDRIFSIGRARELAPRVGLNDAYLWEALYHLRENGWIVTLRRGLYALSSSSVPGITPAHEFEIAMALIQPAAISHWSALHYYGLTDQIPRKIFVLTTTETSIPRLRRTGKTSTADKGYPIGDTIYQFVQVKPERFFGFVKAWVGESRVTVTDPERTLLDGLSMPQYCGDFAEVLRAFETSAPQLNLERIIEYSMKLDTSVAKRLGWILERNGIHSSQLEQLASLPVKGYRKLDPTGPRKGSCDSRWMIQENLPGMLKQ